MIKITVEQDSFMYDDGYTTSRKFSLEIAEDLDINNMVEEIKGILIMMTYTPEAVEEVF